MNSDSKRNTGIDFVKVLACFAVVGLHACGRDSSGINSLFYFLCGFAVPVFFMANGYFVLNRASLNYKYAIKKFVAILKIVVIWNVLFWVAKVIASGELSNPFMMIAESLVQKGFLSHFWFFGALMILTLLAPIIWRVMRSGKRTAILLSTLFAICVVVDVASVIMQARGENALYTNVPQTFRLWTWLFYFVLGGFVGNQKAKQRIDRFYSENKVWLLLVLSALLVALWQFLVGYREFGVLWSEYFYDDPSSMLYATVILVGFDAIVRNSNKTPRVYRFVSSLVPYTMGVYIIHYILRKGIFMVYDFSNGVVNFAIVIVLFLFCTFLVSIAKKVPVVRTAFSM